MHVLAASPTETPTRKGRDLPTDHPTHTARPHSGHERAPSPRPLLAPPCGRTESGGSGSAELCVAPFSEEHGEAGREARAEGPSGVGWGSRWWPRCLGSWGPCSLRPPLSWCPPLHPWGSCQQHALPAPGLPRRRSHGTRRGTPCPANRQTLPAERRAGARHTPRGQCRGTRTTGPGSPRRPLGTSPCAGPRQASLSTQAVTVGFHWTWASREETASPLGPTGKGSP